MTDNDLMLERLRKRDRLILELKEALLQREKQVNQLELVLAHWPADHPRPASDSLMSAEPPAPAAVGPRRVLSKPLESSREPVHALLTAATSGVYADLWTDTEAVLCFNDEVSGGTLRMTMFAPAKPEEAEKRVIITPNFAEPVVTTIKCGQQPTAIFFELPDSAAVLPELRIEVDRAEPASLGDIRRLGVKICAISVEGRCASSRPA